jgi:hypothetical protein
MTYGEYRRAYPRLRVTKGYEGNETRTLQFGAPPETNVTIFSGQLISLDTSGNWVLGAAAGKVPYLALQDSVDPDVLSSGLLTGLSCAGNFAFATGYFTNVAGNFALPDLALVADTVTAGNLTLATAPGGGTIWESVADIIGFTSPVGTGGFGLEQVGPSLSAPDVNGNTYYTPATNTEALPLGGPTYMLHFTTKWLPKRTTSG